MGHTIGAFTINLNIIPIYHDITILVFCLHHKPQPCNLKEYIFFFHKPSIFILFWLLKYSYQV